MLIFLVKKFGSKKKYRTFALAIREHRFSKSIADYNGPVVQLVRIHACHAWGREFESRPDRHYSFEILK